MRIERYYYSNPNAISGKESIYDTEKLTVFHQLEEPCQSLAESLGANLFMDTDDHAGWIIFVCDALNFKNHNQKVFQHIAELADEITMRPSVNTGENSPADIDSAVQLTFWFDFIANDE